jgi:acyl dehydratase
VTATTVTDVEGLPSLAGTHLGHSRWRRISQATIDRFADATDDHQWIHVDVERAAAGGFGGTIAHGYLTLALVVPLLSEILEVEGARMTVNYGSNRVRFPAPVPAGSSIRLGAFLKEVVSVEGGVQALIEATVEVEGGAKPGCVAEIILRYYA